METSTTQTVKKNHGQIARLGFLALAVAIVAFICVPSGSTDATSLIVAVFVVSGCSLMGVIALVFEDHFDEFSAPWRNLLWSPENKVQAYISAALWWFAMLLVLIIVALVASVISA